MHTETNMTKRAGKKITTKITVDEFMHSLIYNDLAGISPRLRARHVAEVYQRGLDRSILTDEILTALQSLVTKAHFDRGEIARDDGNTEQNYKVSQEETLEFADSIATNFALEL
jgi:hypothetical protein